MFRCLSKIALAAGLFTLAAFATEAATIGGGTGNLASPRSDLYPVQYYGGGIDPRSACQDAGGRNWGVPQVRVKVSEARPVGPGLFEMTVYFEGRRAVCVADGYGRVRSFNEAGGYGPGPGPGYGPGPGPGPGYGPGYGPGPGYGADPRAVCQDAAGRYWSVPQVRVSVSGVRPIGGGNLEVTVSLGSRIGICITDQSGQVLSFNER